MVRCSVCQKKINPPAADMYTCRCKNLYCGAHMHDHTKDIPKAFLRSD